MGYSLHHQLPFYKDHQCIRIGKCIGKKISGYIKQVREDGRLDLILTRGSKNSVKSFNEKLLGYIAKSGGFIPLHDKTSPELIKNALGVSKKTFKVEAFF